MTSDFITLKKSDPRFESYLWGAFSSELRAVPIKSHNLGTEEESVTFEVKSVNTRSFMSKLLLFIQLVKPKNLIFVVVPYLFVASQLQMRAIERVFQDSSTINATAVSLFLALIAALFLLSGLNARNDVNDHVSGFDRVNVADSVKPIRLGLIRASTGKKISNILMAISIVIALPVFWLRPETFAVAACAAFLIFVGKLLNKNAYKAQHFGELLLFLLAGPLLTLGFWLTTELQLNNRVWGFSVMWGSLVLFLVQLNNFAHIMTSSQFGIKNTITKLGFDVAPKFIIFCWSMFFLTWCWVQLSVFANFTALVTTLLLSVLSTIFFIRLLNIKSPMGSGLMKIREFGVHIFYFIAICLTLQMTTQLAGA